MPGESCPVLKMSTEKRHMSKHEEKRGRPIKKPQVIENAGELTIPILQNFLSYKYLITRHKGPDNIGKAADIARRAYRNWVQERGVTRKWQRYLNRLAHEMDEF